MSFAVRTVFIRYLGSSYLGINGLFSNVLSLLSFAELGFGTAIVYSMYKPIAENDEKKISAFMNFYAKVYKIVGIFIITAGVILIPFLNFFIGDTSQIPSDIQPIEVIYLLYVLNSALSYFFNYKRSIITASQNGYIDSINQLEFNIIKNSLQIVILILFHSFIGYLIAQLICTLAGNIAISLKADKMFPFLAEYKKRKISKTEFRSILKNVFAMAFHKLGSVLVSGTDNILITRFVGLVATGQYSNYVLLTSTVQTFYNQILTPVTASVGNLIATEDKEKSYLIFKRIFFLNAYIAIFCTSCLISLSNPFITLFWGKNEFDTSLVFLIMLVFFINCLRRTSQIFIDTTGLYWQIKWKSLLEAGINLATSIYFASNLKMGVFGVVLGTLVSDLCTNFWWEPFVVYKYYFNKNIIFYFGNYLKYFVTLLLCIVATSLACERFNNGLSGFILKAVISIIIPNIVIFILYFRYDEYKYFVCLIRKIFK